METVEYAMSMTLNTGNYESVKFNIALTSTVKDGETFDGAYKRVVEEVEEKALEKREELRKAFE